MAVGVTETAGMIWNVMGKQNGKFTVYNADGILHQGRLADSCGGGCERY